MKTPWNLVLNHGWENFNINTGSRPEPKIFKPDQVFSIYSLQSCNQKFYFWCYKNICIYQIALKTCKTLEIDIYQW